MVRLIRLKIGKSALLQSLTGDQKTLAQEWAKWSEGGEKFPGLLDTEATPIGEAPTWATIRSRECKHVMIDRIMKVGMLKQVICKEFVSPFMGMDIIFGCGTLPLPSIANQNLWMKS